MLILNDYIFCDNVINDELLKLLILYGYNNIITFDDLIALNHYNNNYNDKYLMMYRVAGKYMSKAHIFI